MTRPGRPVPRPCEQPTKDGGACPAPARRQPDPDHVYRCPHHSIQPSVRAVIELARQRGGLNVSGQKPVEVEFERFQTAERLDELFDEGLSVLRAELRRRRADKPRITQAIAGLADAKLRLKSLEYTARALNRLKPALSEEAS